MFYTYVFSNRFENVLKNIIFVFFYLFFTTHFHHFFIFLLCFYNPSSFHRLVSALAHRVLSVHTTTFFPSTYIQYTPQQFYRLVSALPTIILLRLKSVRVTSSLKKQLFFCEKKCISTSCRGTKNLRKICHRKSFSSSEHIFIFKITEQ